MRKELPHLMVTERVERRRARGRQRQKYLMDSLCASWKDNVSPAQLIRASEDNVTYDGTAPQQEATRDLRPTPKTALPPGQ